MNWNEEEDFDLNGELSREENAELEEQLRLEEVRRKNHPLTKKAAEIFQIVEAITGSLSEDDKLYESGIMMESAMVIRAKVAGALGSESYLICMQNAAIIRSHAEHLRLSNHTLRMFTGVDEKYIKMFREEMENFRMVFRDWVQEFRAYEMDMEDEWGLFVKG